MIYVQCRTYIFPGLDNLYYADLVQHLKTTGYDISIDDLSVHLSVDDLFVVCNIVA